jgi:uncharacterized membrane protein YkoI
MKKKIGLTIGAMTVAAVIGLLFSQSIFTSAEPDLSIDEVREKVESQYPGKIVELELDKEGNKPVYEVEILLDGLEYELEIDGNNGNVIKLNERLNGALDKKDESNLEITEKETKQKSDDSEAKEKEEKNEEEKQAEQQKTEERNTIISREEAIDIALGQFSGTVDEVELDKDDGYVYYEIEIESAEGDAEIEVDAFTGEILMVDIDLED